ncbi:MAG: RusA family crossover junction endodeoxyribonuclease [Erythrobacter sp.]|nr:RusA family crossover junction endodeoxyribonuclease [Erythrobacter sp.]
MLIKLPFPPASLSGHATRNHWAKTQTTKQWREAACMAAKTQPKPQFEETGDIFVRVTFTPPDNRSDRLNYYNRLKPIFDGIADALGVNDKRFVPIMDRASFNRPSKPGRVVLEVWQ